MPVCMCLAGFVWFYKAEALFHNQFIKLSGLELVDVTEDIEGMCELCNHQCLLLPLIL